MVAGLAVPTGQLPIHADRWSRRPPIPRRLPSVTDGACALTKVATRGYLYLHEGGGSSKSLKNRRRAYLREVAAATIAASPTAPALRSGRSVTATRRATRSCRRVARAGRGVRRAFWPRRRGGPDPGLAAVRYVCAWVRRHPREARLLMLHRREDVAAARWPASYRRRRCGARQPGRGEPAALRAAAGRRGRGQRRCAASASRSSTCRPRRSRVTSRPASRLRLACSACCSTPAPACCSASPAHTRNPSRGGSHRP